MNKRIIEFVEWLTEVGAKIDTPSRYLYEYLEYLNSIGLEIFRGSLGGLSLHPEVGSTNYSYTKNYNLQFPFVLNPRSNEYLLNQEYFNFHKGAVIKSYFKLGIHISEMFKNSPIPEILENPHPIRIPISKIQENPYPIIAEVREKGATDYYILPIMASSLQGSFISFTSSKPHGFTDEDIQFLQTTGNLFGIGWFKFRTQETLESLLNLYLGSKTGRKVLSGKILRGDVEEMEAILWVSDIRGFSKLSSETPPQVLIEWLNEYFELQIKNIHRYGGEVLKLMGDGILAVFPTENHSQLMTMARRSLVCANQSLRILQDWNQIRKKSSQPEIEHGIGLHHGIVQYGNIGSGDRLDFTVIGNDVNLTSRISDLCKGLGEKVLISDAMNQLLPGRLDIAKYSVELKGIKDEQDIFKQKLRKNRIRFA